jgi:hypothetical protein
VISMMFMIMEQQMHVRQARQQVLIALSQGVGIAIGALWERGMVVLNA